jgi:23S rRNA pseudouridine1911/1915/1917 synthase
VEPRILFEDKNILVLDKPAYWIVNDAKTTKRELTVQSWLRKNFHFPIFAFKECRNGIVHRLDKETSGILLVAKDETSFKNLQNQFKKRLVEKEYLALVHGHVEPENGEVKVPIGRLPWNRERFGVLPGGKPSQSFYQVKKYYKGKEGDYTLLRIRPKTGRTHQVRVHLKYLGFPIVSDSFYAGRKQSRKDRVWCPRLFLHAAKISFNQPISGEEMVMESNLPKELKKALRSLYTHSLLT